MGTVFLLTVRQLAGRARLLIMTVLGALPVLFTAMVLRSSSNPGVAEFEVIVLDGMLSASIAPLIVVAIASVAFANELEDRTLANLTLTPIPRWKLVLPKLGAAIAVALPFIAGSAFLTSWFAFNHDITASMAVTLSAVLGLVLYASMFTWLGLVTRQAIGVGLLYIVLWEGFFSGYVSGIRYFSISHYATSFMNGLDPRRFASEDLVGLGPTVLVSLFVVGLFFLLSTRRLRRMDIP